jgi:subtilisin family serine protease
MMVEGIFARAVLKCSVVFLLFASVALSEAKQVKQSRKSLPLDNLPSVVLKNRTNSQYLPDRVIVKLMPRTVTSLSKSAFGVQSIDMVLSRVAGISATAMFSTLAGKHATAAVDLSLFYAVTFSSPNDPFSLADELSKLPEVQYAEPWFIYPVAQDLTTPNDPLFSSQWGLKKIGAEAAWSISQGDTSVVIGIVDSGVDWSHPDLAANIWSNPGETGLDALNGDKRTNSLDDDNNGYVDDYHGWDFAGTDWRSPSGDNNPAPPGDNNNHGTHVAGIAAAVTNNQIGIASIGFKCRILPVKCSADNDIRAGASGYIIDGYQGIAYAVHMGAKIINCSWGGAGGSQFEQDIITYAAEQGALVVASAGNNSKDLFFSPAGYKGVLGVASTDPGDRKSSFSNFGDFVDVCAPGEGIVSTIFFVDPNTHTIQRDYASFNGTSMASPFAAGLAALVRWKFPQFNALQVAEQVRVTCDDITSSNPTYAGQLGKGRINALRAATLENLPSVRLQSFAIRDFPGGNGNGMPQPAETLSVTCVVQNFLASTSSGATIQLTSLSPYLEVTQGLLPVPLLRTLDSTSNTETPFRVYVRPGVPPSHTARLRLTLVDGSFTDAQSFSFLVNPTYQTHNINTIELTLTNNGALGFFDYPDNTEGVGFVFNGNNYLFEGGLILGTSATKLVSVVRNQLGGQDADFFSNDFYTLKTPGIVSQQDGNTRFTDGLAPPTNQLGVAVQMFSYAYSNTPDAQYIILRYDIKNTATDTLKNLHAGIFLDWDVGDPTAENYGKNVSGYDSTRCLGYCYDTTRSWKGYVGIRALDSAASFRSLVNDGTIDLSRGGKWYWVSGGFALTEAGPADIHHVIASGPYTIAPNDSQTVGFALVAGDSSLADIQQNADAAKAKWVALRRSGFIPVSVSDDHTPLPLTFSLGQNYPNPFNPTTAMSYQLSANSFVTLKVFDILGREVATLVNEIQRPGIYRVKWDASGLPSGVYFCRMHAGEFVATRKAVLMK